MLFSILFCARDRIFGVQKVKRIWNSFKFAEGLYGSAYTFLFGVPDACRYFWVHRVRTLVSRCTTSSVAQFEFSRVECLKSICTHHAHCGTKSKKSSFLARSGYCCFNFLDKNIRMKKMAWVTHPDSLKIMKHFFSSLSLVTSLFGSWSVKIGWVYLKEEKWGERAPGNFPWLFRSFTGLPPFLQTLYLRIPRPK